MKVLVCLPADKPRTKDLLAAASRLAAGLSAPLSIVHVYPASWSAAPAGGPAAWHLRTDDPAPALKNFLRLHRITHVVLAPEACGAWGRTLRETGKVVPL
ncbi:hypothetical protein EPO15_17495 [bacterium]|nr:MAG: hypothetical protein EPO15_17495 [bacterium]